MAAFFLCPTNHPAATVNFDTVDDNMGCVLAKASDLPDVSAILGFITAVNGSIGDITGVSGVPGWLHGAIF